MKRCLSFILVIVMLLMLTSCNFSMQKSATDEANETIAKSGIEKLRDYIRENGANYQGVYKCLHLETDAVTSISCTSNGSISFYYSSENEKGDSAVEMNFYEGSVTQTVNYEYEFSGYTLTATGTLYTNFVNSDDCPLYGISYREDFPSYISKSDLDEIASDLFPLYTRLMLSKVNLMLVEYVGIELEDLGFENW